jgi:NAD-dependent SIR2 family protein deacetylase
MPIKFSKRSFSGSLVHVIVEKNEWTKRKELCDKCKKMTWHEYTESNKKRKGMTKCLECGHKRIL